MFSYDEVQKFNATDISIYKYIIENGNKIPYMTIRELASEVNFSTSTILRFCEKVQCNSYNEFKDRVREEIKEIKEMQPKEDLIELQNYFNQANTHSFERKINEGANIIRKAKKVIFVGQGSSGTLARYGARYFSNLGKFSIGLEDTYYPISKELAKDTVLIVLSVSGETKEVVSLLEQFKVNQSKVLSITNQNNSTIEKLSDWHIAYNMKTQSVYGSYNATTQVPVIFLVEALARRL